MYDVQTDYLNLDHLIRNNKRADFLNRGAVTMGVHTQLRYYLSNRESKFSRRNHSLIQGTVITSVVNVTVGNQILASDVYRRISAMQNFQNWTPQIRKFTTTRKSLKPKHKDKYIYIAS